MSAYYNEIDPFAAEWLRNLIAAGHIAPGDVDTRSIEDVCPSDLAPYRQAHFFAGIGVWSYALRRAGWPDDCPIWTGSCPCQPFSAAGKGSGFADERHLWPHFHWLIAQCRPDVVLGEQVASKDGLGWIDLVQADLEGTGYASGAVDTCAAGFGAPHIRQRLYWFGERVEHAPCDGRQQWRAEPSGRGSAGGRGDVGMAHAEDQRGRERSGGLSGTPEAREGKEAGQRHGNAARPDDAIGELADTSGQGLERQDARTLGDERSASQRSVGAGRVANASRQGLSEQRGRWLEPARSSALSPFSGLADHDRNGRQEGIGVRSVRAEHDAEHGRPARSECPRPTNGFWRDPDWLFCRDAKWRPVEPGTFPLAHGAPARVGRLRGYGNAINAEAATAFIEAYLEVQP